MTIHRDDDATIQPEPLPPTGGPRRAEPGSARGKVADRVERAAESVEDRGHLWQARGGARRPVGKAAVSTGHVLESGADFLRDHSADELKSELEAQVRAKPFASLAVAAVAGFVLARILRH